MKPGTPRLGPLEIFGLKPLRQALADTRRAIVGDGFTPRVQWDLTSLQIFKPTISLPTWLGLKRQDRRAPIYNFFNRIRPPHDEGYSVRVTFARDFLDGRYTYDGHHGTDFAVPVGTPVVAGAPGVVIRVHNDLDHGGLKVCVDHGQGLFTTSSHLARASVREGQRVRRGQVLGWSGASGLELILFFPWVAPHLHYNTWLNAEPHDPFARPGSEEVSLWRRHNNPVPWDGRTVAEDQDFRPTQWSLSGVQAAIEACKDPGLRERICGLPSLARQAAELMFLMNARPALFSARPSLYTRTWKRGPRLDLPFLSEDFEGIAFPPAGW